MWLNIFTFLKNFFEDINCSFSVNSAMSWRRS
jgi:hypothetical protein